jgi:hypothetical protein
MHSIPYNAFYGGGVPVAGAGEAFPKGDLRRLCRAGSIVLDSYNPHVGISRYCGADSAVRLELEAQQERAEEQCVLLNIALSAH